MPNRTGKVDTTKYAWKEKKKKKKKEDRLSVQVISQRLPDATDSVENRCFTRERIES